MGDIIDQTAFNEAQDIVVNKNNPRHEAYHRNDKATVDHVTNLYRRADPSMIETDDSTPEQLRNTPPPDNKTAGTEQDQGSAQPAEVTPELDAAFGLVAPQWGGPVGSPEFQENRSFADRAIAAAGDGLLARFDVGQDPQKMADVLWLAAKAGRMMRD